MNRRNVTFLYRFKHYTGINNYDLHGSDHAFKVALFQAPFHGDNQYEDAISHASVTKIGINVLSRCARHASHIRHLKGS